MSRLKAAESELVTKYKGSASILIADLILKAPDVFVAAVLMKNSKMQIGRNDDKVILDQLIQKSGFDFKDIVRKLVLIK